MRYKALTLRSLPHRVALSSKSLFRLLYFKPQCLFLALASSVVFYELIFWFLNLGLLQYLLTTEYLPIADKLSMLIGSYSGIFIRPFSATSLTLFVVSLLQGVSVAAFVYLVRSERAMQQSFIRDAGGIGVAGALSVIGLGCAACGTSLVTPLLTFFFATSSIALAEQVGFYSAMFALVVSVITAYLSGMKLALRLES